MYFLFFFFDILITIHFELSHQALNPQKHHLHSTTVVGPTLTICPLKNQQPSSLCDGLLQNPVPQNRSHISLSKSTASVSQSPTPAMAPSPSPSATRFTSVSRSIPEGQLPLSRLSDISPTRRPFCRFLRCLNLFFHAFLHSPEGNR